MSEWRVEVVEIGALEPHHNADTLSVTRVFGGYPCCVKTGEFKTGDRAVYVPINSLVECSDPRWQFLQPPCPACRAQGLDPTGCTTCGGAGRQTSGDVRIRALKLRGIFSMGLLMPLPTDRPYAVGEDVATVMGVRHYVAPEEAPDGEFESCPFDFPDYTDIMALRRYPDVLRPGEPVVATEKLHGKNGRFVFRDGRLWIGSMATIQRETDASIWWRAAREIGLADRLASVADIILYGEVVGLATKMKLSYGVPDGVAGLRFFDARSLVTMQYLDYADFEALCGDIGVDTVPVLYRSGYDAATITALAEGKSTLDSRHCREGVVVRTATERWDDAAGRCVLKLHGQDFLLRGGKKGK